jgi:pyruvate dehydrogenase E2 component (dihydrolipoamide acetyltransferase)
MATRVLLPKQGLQMVEGQIVRWLRKPGDAVREGEDLVVIETDKATLDIPAPASGVLLAILRGEGETVPVAETIAVIGVPGEDISALEAAAGAAAEPAARAAGKPVSQPAAAAPAAPTAAGAPAEAGGRVFASPRARTAAAQAGIDIRALRGSGPDGLVIERDVRAQAARPSGVPGQAAAAPAPAQGRLVQPGRMRSTIARRMRESLETAAQAEMQVDVDAGEMVRLRERLKAGGQAVSFTDILVKAAAAALAAHPNVNSSWTPAGILVRTEINIGLAVSVEEGLLVPVIRGVDRLTLGAVAAVGRDLAGRAREGKLLPREMEGAGFTVSNLGMFGVDRFTAIINQPESAILAVGQIVDRPIAVDGVVRVRPMMTITLSYDHRLIDGAPAARFLAAVREYAENPLLVVG